MIQSPAYSPQGGHDLTAKNRRDTKRTSVPPPANEPPVLVSETRVVTSTMPPPVTVSEPEPGSGRYVMVNRRRAKKEAPKSSGERCMADDPKVLPPGTIVCAKGRSPGLNSLTGLATVVLHDGGCFYIVETSRGRWLVVHAENIEVVHPASGQHGSDASEE
jgi:hypothetical protein